MLTGSNKIEKSTDVAHSKANKQKSPLTHSKKRSSLTQDDRKVKSGEDVLVAHNIKARKKASDQLVFSEKMYRRLYETTQDGIMARDLQGRMIDCNQAYAKMLGYTKKELKSLTVHQLLPEKWYGQRERIVNKVLQTVRSIVFEREYKRKDGTIFPASVRTWRLTDGKGKAIGIWSIVRDISEQKELQKKLKIRWRFRKNRGGANQAA
jgi:PAS domain S-box-containing protein